MDFYDVIKTRRSVRRYADRPIGDDVLKRILDAARIAPSGNNRQPWSFVVIRDADRRKQIARACYDQKFIADAPVVIVCCGKPYENTFGVWKNDCYLADAVIAMDHLILAARNEGIGTCWIGAVHDDQVHEIIDAPNDVKVLMVIPLGYPTTEGAFNDTFYRKAMTDICFAEQYGKPFNP